jgi:hypothetical protein
MPPDDAKGDSTTPSPPVSVSSEPVGQPVSDPVSPSSQPLSTPSQRPVGMSMRPAPKSFSDLIDEFVGMTITYVKQETVDPIRALGRFLGLGLAAAVLISIGWLVLALAVVRLLQAETTPHLGGSFTWVPYIGGILTAVGGAAWAVNRIMKAQK